MEKITNERVEQVLPENIKSTDLLTNESKTILAVLMNSMLLTKEAQESGVLIISNGKLRQLVGIKTDKLMSGLRELEEYQLIERKAGHTRTSGNKAIASEYRLDWNKIFKEPLKKKTSEELFELFLKSSETPMGTATTTAIPTSTTTSTTTSTSISTKTSTLTKTENTMEISKQNQEEKITSLKKLQIYFIKKIDSYTREINDMEELDKIRFLLLEELESFDDINNYSNVKFIINNSIDKKIERLMVDSNTQSLVFS